MDRRSFLRAGATALAATTIPAVIVAAEQPEFVAPSGPADPVFLAREVLDYHNRLKLARPQHEEGPGYRAMSIPFACLPLNLYVRGGDEVPIREPRLAPLVDALRQPAGSDLPQKVHAALMELVKDTIPGQLVKRIKRRDKAIKTDGGHVDLFADRIVTPKMVIDIDELDSRGAAMIMMSSLDIAREITLKMDQARSRHRELHGAEPENVLIRRTEIEMFWKREAFMLESFYYGTFAGVIY